MNQLLESKGESGVSMAANLGEEEQSQKGKEVGDQQKEQQTEAKAIEEDDHEDNHEKEEDNEDKTATERLKSVPKVTNISKEFYIYIYIYISHKLKCFLKNVVTFLTLFLHFCHHLLKRGCLLNQVTPFLSFSFHFIV